MGRTLIYAAACGGLSGALLILLSRSGFGFLFAYFVPLPLFFAGLSFGVVAAGVAGAIGTLIVFLTDGLVASTYLVGFALPPLILTRQALLARQPDQADETTWEWYPPGGLVMWLAGLASAGAALAMVLTLGFDGGLPGAIRPMLTRFAAAMPELGVQEAAVDGLSRWLPAMIVGSWMAMMSVNFVLGQVLSRRFNLALRPSPHLAALRLPSAAAPLLALALVAGWLGGDSYGWVGWTFATALSFAYFLQGLAVLHWLVQTGRMPAPFLWMVYGALVVFGGLGVPVALLGLFEEWAQVRRRNSAPAPAREDE